MYRTGSLLVIVLTYLFAVPATGKTLSMSRIGEGMVVPEVGNHDYLRFQSVTIEAIPAPGWVFDRWEGELAGSPNPHSVEMDRDWTATAVFLPLVEEPANALVRYVGKYDPNSQARLISKESHLGWDGYTLELTSQSWRNETEVDSPLWSHDLSVIVPWFTDEKCLLLVNGGSNPVQLESPDPIIAAAAFSLNLKYAQLDQVPNQPLFFTDEESVERRGDAIIAYSLDKFLITGDDEWPVHVAMVKSVVKAMDAIQQQVRTVEDFLLVGASKRGWTTWLTAAIDPRIKAMVPLVSDLINIDQQVDHHWESYGFYTDAVQDYIDFDLFCRVSDPWAEDLLKIVDPYEYKTVYTLPKLIVNGSGDQFFLPDSSKYYYDEIPGPSYLHYLPNSSHSLEGLLTKPKQLLGMFHWAQQVIDGEPTPEYNWFFQPDGSIIVQTEDGPSKVRLWQATNPDARDFRMESIGPAFTSTVLFDRGGGRYKGSCPAPDRGWRACFIELTFGTQVYSTAVNVIPDIEPYDGLHCR